MRFSPPAATLVALSGLAGLPTTAAAEDIIKHFHESFEIGSAATLHLEHGDGAVEVTPWDRDVVDVEVHYRAAHQRIGIGSAPTLDVEFRREGDDIFVTERMDHGFTIGFQSHSEHEYTYTVRAPDRIGLDLHGEDGQVRIREWTGSISCSVDDGDVHLEDIESEATRVEVRDGDLEIVNLRGSLTINAEDGDVTLSGCALEPADIALEDGGLAVIRCEGSFTVGTEDGDVEFDRVEVERLDVRAEDARIELVLLPRRKIDWEVTTGDGDVSLEFGSDTSAMFSVETTDGRIRLDVSDAEAINSAKNTAQGKIGGGDGRIRIQTGAGAVRLHKGG